MNHSYLSPSKLFPYKYACLYIPVAICLALLAGCAGSSILPVVLIDSSNRNITPNLTPIPDPSNPIAPKYALSAQSLISHTPEWDTTARKRYIPRTLNELTRLAQIHLGDLERTGIGINQGDDFASRIPTTFSGKFREISQLSQEVTVKWLTKHHPKMDSLEAKRLYPTEGLFYEAGVEYWLPVQANLLSSMRAEAKAGHIIILYLSMIGAYRSDSQTTWVLPVDEFLVPKELSKTPWQVQIYCPTTNAGAQIAFDTARNLDLQKKPLEAEKLYRQAIELDSRYCDAMNNLGFLLRQQGRLDETIAWYQKSLEVKPDNPMVLNNLGIVYKMQKKWSAAIQVFEKLVQVDPLDPEGYYSLGRAFFDLGRFQEAAPNLEVAELLYYQDGSPYFLDAQYYLGLSYFLLDDFARARGYLAPVYSRRQDDPRLNMCLGYSYLKTEPQELGLSKKYMLNAENLGYRLPEMWMKELLEVFGDWPPSG